jgi:hypothetical protein
LDVVNEKKINNKSLTFRFRIKIVKSMKEEGGSVCIVLPDLYIAIKHDDNHITTIFTVISHQLSRISHVFYKNR